MSIKEFNRGFAPDNQVTDNDNWLTATYKDSRLAKVVTQFLLLFLAAGFNSFAENHGWSAEYAKLLRQATIDGDTSSFSGGMVWLSACMLLHLYIYRRRCFYWSIAAGLLWLPFGDLIAAPFWMATVGYLAAAFTRFKSFTTLLIFLIIISGSDYSLIYASVWHPYGLIALSVLLVIAIRVERIQIGKVPPETHAPGTQSRLNMFGDAPADNQPQSAEKEVSVAEFGRDDDVNASVWEPEEKPILTAVQRPFAAYWIALHKLKQQPALPALLQTELEGVIGYAEHILDCMQNDPNDVQPGSAFLDRYLTQVTMVVKRGLLLSGQLSTHGKTQEVEQQCLNALQALNSAFAQQHLRLLENDTLEFETDLTVLNSLLKTDGFKQ